MGREFENGYSLVKQSLMADELEIYAIPPEIGGPILVTKSKERIGTILSLFKFPDKPIRGESQTIDGEEVWLVPYCQCLGDYELVFRMNGEETTRFTIHHAQFIRVGSRKQEFDLTPQSGRSIMDRLDHLKKLAIAKDQENAAGQAKARK